VQPLFARLRDNGRDPQLRVAAGLQYVQMCATHQGTIMITASIERVGDSFRVKFSGHTLVVGPLTEGYFTAAELDELQIAIDWAKRQIEAETPSACARQPCPFKRH
jgi:hypothetical protein